MAVTVNRGYPIASVSSAPNGPYEFQRLAEAVDLDVKAVDAKHTKHFGHMGITNGFTAPGNGGRAPMDAAQVLRGGMTFDNVNDALTVPVTGLYRVTAQAYASGSGWGTQISTVYVKPASGAADYQSGLNARHYRESANGPPDTCFTYGGTLPLLAGDKLFIANFYTGSTSTWGTSGYNGTFLEVEFSQV